VRPPFDPVMMFKILVIQTTNYLSDERADRPHDLAVPGETHESQRHRASVRAVRCDASAIRLHRHGLCRPASVRLCESCPSAKNRRDARCPRQSAAANNAKSKICSRVEHVFAEQKERMHLFIRTIGNRQGDNQNRTGQPRLQLQTPALPPAHGDGIARQLQS
jgi:hypothetical protein